MNMIRIITSSTPLLHQLSGITLLIASRKKIAEEDGIFISLVRQIIRKQPKPLALYKIKLALQQNKFGCTQN